MIPTSSQTIGPFWHGLADPALADLTRFGTSGAPRVLAGTVYDGDGAPVVDACVEVWLPGVGWGRCATDARGAYRFVVVEAPVIAVIVLARGLLKPVWTRCYFDEPDITHARRDTLRARLDGDLWRWDIRLQGPGETMFLTW